MPLQWQPVELKFGSSQDESAAPFALPQPLLQQLQNARVMKTGEVRKRNGWQQKASVGNFETLIAVDDTVFTAKQREVFVGAPFKLGTVDQFLDRIDYHEGSGSFSLSEVEVLERSTVIRDSLTGDGTGSLASSCPDFCVPGSTNLAIIAWEVALAATPVNAAQHVIFAAVIDITTRQPVDGPRRISSPTSGPCSGPLVVQDTPTRAVVVYARAPSNELRAVAFDCNTLTWGADTVVQSDLNAASPHYDACDFANGGTGWFLAYRNTAPTMKVVRVSNVTATAVASAGEDSSAGSVSVYADAVSDRLWWAWYDATNGVRACIRQATVPATIILANTTMEVVVDTALQMTWAPGPGSSNILVWTTDASLTALFGYGRKQTKYRTLSTGGAKGTQAQISDVILIGKGYSAANGFTYAPVLYDAADIDATNVTSLRSFDNQVAFTMAICDTQNANAGTAATSFRVAASWAFGEAGRKRLQSSLSGFRVVGTATGNEQWFALAPEFDQILVGGQLLGRAGVDICRQKIGEPPKIFAARIGDNVVFSGGVPQVWDGAALNEYGFLVPPENAAVAAAGSGGNLTAGSYGVQAVWEYRLATGDLAQSAPSLVKPVVGQPTATSVAAVASDRLNVVVPALSLTRKFDESGFGRGALVRLYRTESNGTIYYSEGDFTTASGFAANAIAPVLLSPNVAQADATVITHKSLYTTGDILSNFPPPALSYIFTHRNRLFGIVAENRRQIAFTHTYQVGELPGWHPDLVIDVPDEAVALATVDEKLVILCKNGVYLISGDGPDRKGLNSDYQEPFRLNSPHGCTRAESVVQFPDGVIYHSPTGFCLINRQASVTRIGGPVEDTLALFPYVQASCVLREQEWIYWSVTDAASLVNSSGGRIIVYDWRHNVWSVDNVQAIGGEFPAPADTFCTSLVHTSAGTMATFRAGGTLNLHAGFIDLNNAWINLRLSTALFHPGANQMFQRARWMTVLGQNRGIHQLTLTVNTYSHTASAVQTQAFSWVTADFSAMSSYTPKAHLANQVGAFFQVVIADAPDPSLPAVVGDSASFIGLVMDVGLKSETTRNIQASMR